MPSPQPQALLFDLGGVLVDIDFGLAIRAWAPYSSQCVDVLRDEFKFDLAYQRHERGEISADEYFDHLAATLGLSASRSEIAKGWNSIFVGEFAETRGLVERARERLPCYAFTNTNASHMATWSVLFPELVQSFDRIFASHEMGLRKPELAAFEHISKVTGIAASSIVFYDDLIENVEAARLAGLQAVHVRSAADVRESLTSLGYAL